MPGGVSRFWRWLTCGHGRHRRQLGGGVDLAVYPPEFLAVRSCSRCGLIEVLE